MSKFLQDDKKVGEIVLIEKLSEDFSNLYLSHNYSDIIFIVENEQIPCKLLTIFYFIFIYF